MLLPLLIYRFRCGSHFPLASCFVERAGSSTIKLRRPALSLLLDRFTRGLATSLWFFVFLWRALRCACYLNTMDHMILVFSFFRILPNRVDTYV